MGVVAAGVVITLTGWTLVDLLVSVMIGVIILIGSGRVLRKSLHILEEGMPEGLTATEVSEAMDLVAGVEEVHDLHVWTVSPGYISLSAHVVLNDQSLSRSQTVMNSLKRVLVEDFDIQHTAIQFGCDNYGQCAVVSANGGQKEACQMVGFES